MEFVPTIHDVNSTRVRIQHSNMEKQNYDRMSSSIVKLSTTNTLEGSFCYIFEAHANTLEHDAISINILFEVEGNSKEVLDVPDKLNRVGRKF